MKRAATSEDLSLSQSEDVTPVSKISKIVSNVLERVSPKKFKIPKKNSNQKAGDVSKLEDSLNSTDSLICQNPEATESKSPANNPPPQTSAQMTSSEPTPSPQKDNAEAARQHYNNLVQVKMSERHESKIFNLRGFNNYVKSLVINDFLGRIGPLGKYGAKILDLGCGKGGDLRKWSLAKPRHVVCVDIADVSVAQCKGRYEEPRSGCKFDANFIAADCTRVKLEDKYKEDGIAGIQFDLVSCQFALHYAFESQDQAKCMLSNAVSNLKPGGFFFGTIPRSNYFVKKYRELDGVSKFGNDVFYVDFKTPGIQTFPLFGAKYVFYLDGAVEELSEFLIHFPLLDKMLVDLGMECVLAEPFIDYVFKDGVLKEQVIVQRTRGLNDSGTLQEKEWEVVACYMVFGFRKLTDEELSIRRDNKRQRVE